MISNYLIALLITILLESIVVSLFIRKDYLKLAYYVILINCFTLPLGTYFIKEYINSWYLIELIIFIVESALWILLLKEKYWKLILMSFVANGVTAVIGLIAVF